MNEHKKNRHYRHKIGPGGLRCFCCNPHHNGKSPSQKSTKQKINRMVRRAMKQELKDVT